MPSLIVVSDAGDAEQVVAAATSGRTVLSITELSQTPEMQTLASLRELAGSVIHLDQGQGSSDQKATYLNAFHSQQFPGQAQMILSGFGWAGGGLRSAQAFMARIRVSQLGDAFGWIEFGRLVTHPRFGELRETAHT